MKKKYTDEQRKAIFDIFTLMSILCTHPEYKVIKEILLSLNEHIMMQR